MMSASTTCVANFETVPPITYLLTIQTNGGKGIGTVTSSPAGINCGTICSNAYNANTPVVLTPTPTSNSIFAGWIGTGCSSGTVTMSSSRNCTATFTVNAPTTYNLVALISPTGTGTISADSTISCGINCWTYKTGATAKLTAVGTNSTASWTGCTSTGTAGTSTATVVGIIADSQCSVIFTNIPQVVTHNLNIELFGTGNWYCDDKSDRD